MDDAAVVQVLPAVRRCSQELWASQQAGTRDIGTTMCGGVAIRFVATWHAAYLKRQTDLVDEGGRIILRIRTQLDDAIENLSTLNKL